MIPCQPHRRVPSPGAFSPSPHKVGAGQPQLSRPWSMGSVGVGSLSGSSRPGSRGAPFSGPGGDFPSRPGTSPAGGDFSQSTAPWWHNSTQRPSTSPAAPGEGRGRRPGRPSGRNVNRPPDLKQLASSWTVTSFPSNPSSAGRSPKKQVTDDEPLTIEDALQKNAQAQGSLLIERVYFRRLQQSVIRSRTSNKRSMGHAPVTLSWLAPRQANPADMR